MSDGEGQPRAENSAAAAAIADHRDARHATKSVCFIGFLNMARGLLTLAASKVRPRSAAFVGVKAMMFAIGAATSLLDSLQALSASKSSSASSSTGQSQGAANPFDLGASTQTTATPTTGFSPGTSGFSAISPQTMSALLDAQSQSGTTSSTTTSPSDALQNLFNDIDANGDGSITKSEFENALGAGGTNTAAADKVFGELDSNGDGTVSLDELKSALQSAGSHHGGHHHMHAGGASGSGDSSADSSSGSSSNPLLQALAGASSTSATNSDGSTTTTISYADGSKVSLTMPAASTTSSTSNTATSSYNLIEQMIQREAKALSASVSSSLSVSV
jgi:hypothetical protein